MGKKPVYGVVAAAALALAGCKLPNITPGYTPDGRRVWVRSEQGEREAARAQQQEDDERRRWEDDTNRYRQLPFDWRRDAIEAVARYRSLSAANAPEVESALRDADLKLRILCDPWPWSDFQEGNSGQYPTRRWLVANGRGNEPAREDELEGWLGLNFPGFGWKELRALRAVVYTGMFKLEGMEVYRVAALKEWSLVLPQLRGADMWVRDPVQTGGPSVRLNWGEAAAAALPLEAVRGKNGSTWLYNPTLGVHAPYEP